MANNSISQDFRLFDQDESAFDYPLFQESLKLQQLQLQHFANSTPFTTTTTATAVTTSSNPLCTPQTPSLDLPLTMPNKPVQLGFDGFAPFMDNAGSVHGSNAPLFDQSFSSKVPQQASLVDTPYTPYLDTPYQTPYLADFGVEDMAHLNSTVAHPAAASTQVFSLFPEFDLSSLSVYNTIEPNMLMQQQYPPHLHQHQHQYRQQDSMDLQSALPSPSVSDLSSPALSVLPSPSTESKSLVDSGLDSDNDSDDQDEDDQDEDELEESSSEDEDDDEFVPSRSSPTKTAATNKRKARSIGQPLPTKKARSTGAGRSGGKKLATKRFPCNYAGCHLRFARLFNLHTHERTHDPDQVRPFVCSVAECAKRFSRKHDLQRHEASVHKGERNFACHACGKPFSRQDGLRRHLAVRGSCAETGWNST